jgi:hypothetical protein
MPLLGHIDMNTGLPVRKPKPVRYEKENPGDMVHIDVKKLGRIPDGGGHRTLGRAVGKRVKKTSRPRHAFLHSGLDYRTPAEVEAAYYAEQDPVLATATHGKQ